MSRQRGIEMKRFLKWSAVVAGCAVAGTLVFRAIQSGRAKLKNALGEAEAVADRTRAALEETETALRTARTSI
jgi:type VI protein secretion system component VasK